MYYMYFLNRNTEIRSMKLPDNAECDDCYRIIDPVFSGINHTIPHEQTVVQQQLPTAEGFDDDQLDVDYLSLATGDNATDHSPATSASRLVPMSLIDRVLASPEQTYEQLLSSFMYFTAGLYNLLISARQHIAYMLNALYAIACPSVCLSVHLSHGWIIQKRSKLGL